MGQIILVSAISGAGKDGFIKGISEKYPSFYFSDSFTTKPLSERDVTSKKKYTSISDEDFMERLNHGFFLEHGQSHGYYYGTPIKALRQASIEKKDLLLEVDVKKASDLLQQKEFDYDFKPCGVFLWRGFDPLKDFNEADFSSFIEKNLRLREPGINDENVKERIKSALGEYLHVREYQKLFRFIENVEGDQSAAVKEFCFYYKPTLRP